MKKILNILLGVLMVVTVILLIYAIVAGATGPEAALNAATSANLLSG